MVRARVVIVEFAAAAKQHQPAGNPIVMDTSKTAKVAIVRLIALLRPKNRNRVKSNFDPASNSDASATAWVTLDFIAAGRYLMYSSVHKNTIGEV